MNGIWNWPGILPFLPQHTPFSISDQSAPQGFPHGGIHWTSYLSTKGITALQRSLAPSSDPPITHFLGRASLNGSPSLPLLLCCHSSGLYSQPDPCPIYPSPSTLIGYSSNLELLPSS